MTHRAEQIIDAIVAAITLNASSLGVASNNIYKHRVLSLAESQGEMPAVTVNIGDDNPVGEFGVDNVAFIDSLLEVSIVSYAAGDREDEVKTALFNHRRYIHASLMTDQTLGLSYVMGVRYGGAPKPELDAAERIAGAYESRWLILYRMNITDPGDS